VEYDLTRAHVLLRDLERVAQGRAPAVQLIPPTADQPTVRGDFTRFGLLKLAVRLARAALDARATVAVHASGRVEPDGHGGLIQLHLADDTPPAPETRPVMRVGLSGCLAVLTVLGLAAIGLASVVWWAVWLVRAYLAEPGAAPDRGGM